MRFLATTDSELPRADRRVSTISSFAVPDGSYLIKEYADVIPRMEMLIAEISSVLDLHPDVTEILLERNRWNRSRVMDSYFSDDLATRKEAGIDLLDFSIVARLSDSGQSAMPSSSPTTAQLTCEICFCSFDPQTEGFALGCNHWFCRVN